ncbi:MAG: glycosyltransferase family A protein [Luteimonas sp.]
MNSLITTIIPTYRRPERLRKAIASVVAQTYPHIRICVYDNASGDGTAEVVAEFARQDPRVHYVCHAENIGSLANFNYGLDAVETPFFSFLSDDDMLLPDFYMTAMRKLEQHPDAAFWGGTTIVMEDDGTIRDATHWPEAYFPSPEGLLAMIANNYLIWTSVLFRSEPVCSIGRLDPEVGAPIDTDYMLRLAARFPFITSPDPAAIWTCHAGSSTVMADPDFIWPGWLKTIRNVTGDERLPPDVRASVEHSLTEQVKRQLFQIGYNSIRQKKLEDAREVAMILRQHYRQDGRANLLASLAWACQHVPPTYRLVASVDSLRKLARRGARTRARALQLQFGKYARFLTAP